MITLNNTYSFLKDDIIGRGSFGIVFRGKNFK